MTVTKAHSRAPSVLSENELAKFELNTATSAIGTCKYIHVLADRSDYVL
jgi:hypothetical protein